MIQSRKGLGSHWFILPVKRKPAWPDPFGGCGVSYRLGKEEWKKKTYYYRGMGILEICFKFHVQSS